MSCSVWAIPVSSVYQLDPSEGLMGGTGRVDAGVFPLAEMSSLPNGFRSKTAVGPAPFPPAYLPPFGRYPDHACVVYFNFLHTVRFASCIIFSSMVTGSKALFCRPAREPGFKIFYGS